MRADDHGDDQRRQFVERRAEQERDEVRHHGNRAERRPTRPAHAHGDGAEEDDQKHEVGENALGGEERSERDPDDSGNGNEHRRRAGLRVVHG